MFNFLQKFKAKPMTEEFAPASILIIEDNEVDRLLIQRILEKKKYRVLVALDGEAGLKLAFENPVDLILLDYHLPGMNGIEVCETLKRDARTKAVPVIFLTTMDGADIIHFYEAGAENYMHKVISPKPFLNEVELMLKEFKTKKQKEAV